MQVEELSEFGRLWAEANTDSLVARVALEGYNSDWPVAHVETAIKTVNKTGADVAGV